MIRENYDEALTALGNWFDLKDKPGAQAYAMKAQLLYQNQDWDQALGAIDQAIDMQRAGEGEVRENWYLLKRGSTTSRTIMRDCAMCWRSWSGISRRPPI